MRASITFAAFLAGSCAAAAVTETVWDITTKTITVLPGQGPAPTSASAHVETQNTQVEVQHVAQAQAQAQAQPEQSTPQPDLGSVVSGLDPYKTAVLMAHNGHRAQHGVGPLSWSTELEQLAEEQANECVWGHQTTLGGTVYGQNIAAGVSPADIATVIDGLFYNNEAGAFTPFYGQPSPAGFQLWGHFTQVVWKSTTQVGCVTKMCGSGVAGMSLPGMQPFYTVCNYSPAGNMDGQYANNVFPPRS